MNIGRFPHSLCVALCGYLLPLAASKGQEKGNVRKTL